MNVLATFQTYATTSQTIPLGFSAVGATIFGYASFTFLLGIYVGPLFDKYGPRWLLLSGTICLAASLLLASLGTERSAILTALGIFGGSPHPHARIFRTTGSTPTVMAVSCAQLAASLPLPYMSAYVLGRGLSHAESFEVVAVVNASSAVGRAGVWAVLRCLLCHCVVAGGAGGACG
jgi:hypothetical protein